MWTQLLIAAFCISCVLCAPGSQNPTTCSPGCKASEETCVKLSRCLGKQCFMCAETQSIQNVKCPAVPAGGSVMSANDVGRQQMEMAMQKMMGSQQQSMPTPSPKKTQNTGLFGGNSMTDFFMTGRLMGAEGMGLGLFGM